MVVGGSSITNLNQLFTDFFTISKKQKKAKLAASPIAQQIKQMAGSLAHLMVVHSLFLIEDGKESVKTVLVAVGNVEELVVARRVKSEVFLNLSQFYERKVCSTEDDEYKDEFSCQPLTFRIATLSITPSTSNDLTHPPNLTSFTILSIQLISFIPIVPIKPQNIKSDEIISDI